MSKHITEKQRYAISKMLQVPMSKKDIAEAVALIKVVSIGNKTQLRYS